MARRRLLAVAGLALLLGTAGCFLDTTALGPPERVGRFSIQKFRQVSTYETGKTVRDYFEVSHGRFFSTRLGMPPDGWSYFDRVTRLPSKSPAWLVESGAWSAVVTEKDGSPAVETLWRGGDPEPIEAISATRWHIPDYARIREPAEGATYRGGQVFDGETLAQHPLPNQPTHRIGRFVALSPDSAAVAWFQRFYLEAVLMETAGHSIQVSDARGATGPALDLSAAFLSRHPLPDTRTGGSSPKDWLDAHFSWRLDEAKRWRLAPKPE